MTSHAVAPRCALALVVAGLVVAGIVACQGQGVCAGGESLDTQHSKPPRTALCLSIDRRSARYTERYPNGVVQHECSFRLGRANGKYRGWFQNGKPWLEGEFREGGPQGRWRLFDETGRQTAEANYEDGELRAGARLAFMAPCPKVEAESLAR